MGHRQGTLFDDPLRAGENPSYLSNQLITYMGNKRALLPAIAKATVEVRKRLGRRKLKTFDVFSGSGAVSRFLKGHSSHITANDIQGYAATVSRCYLSNESEIDLKALKEEVHRINDDVDADVTPPAWSGFIQELYSPKDDSNIKEGERVFYTRDNARRLDDYRRIIGGLPEWMRDLLLGPLLSAASIHVNTAGIFNSFYKDKKTGIGKFGGSNGDALSRIRGKIRAEVPVLSDYECEYEVMQLDAKDAAWRALEVDLAYLDPPYNELAYGSNYFMLNLINEYRRPLNVTKVSGVPLDWQRSDFNSKATALPMLKDVCKRLDTKFLLVSFNNEGFVSPEDMRAMLGEFGPIEEFHTRYGVYNGGRKKGMQRKKVQEHLFLVEKS